MTRALSGSMLLDPTLTDGGNGGKAPEPSPSPEPTTQSEAFTALLAKHKNDGNAVAAMLHGENFQLRERNRELKSRLPEGSLVLNADEAKEWRAFASLGKSGEVRKALDMGRADTTALADIRRSESFREAAKVAGYEPGVFARLAKQDGLELVVEESKGKDGKAVAKVFVKGEDDTRTPIDDYAAKHWGEMMPALKPGEARTARPSGGSPAPGGRTDKVDRSRQERDRPRAEDQLRSDVNYASF